MKNTLRLAILALFISCSLWASADDVTDAINEGISAYKEGAYSKAASQLEYAASLVRQKKAEEILAVFPDALSGWTASEAKSESAGAAMFGGGITASRSYSKDDTRIDIEMIMDSPMLASMAGMFSNPSLITMNGGKLIQVQGQQGILNEQSGNPEVMLMVNNNAMFTLRGSNASTDDVKAYAEALRLNKL
ncbi:MAG TPA: hypothetical protein VIC08_06770 [Cellvibrionaceae bacterium]